MGPAGSCRLYHITLWTFVLALGHFLSEAFIFKTAPLTIGVMAPLIVASKCGLHWGVMGDYIALSLKWLHLMYKSTGLSLTFMCFSRLFYHGNADWIPVFSRVTRRSRSTTEEAELNSLRLDFSLWSTEPTSTATTRQWMWQAEMTWKPHGVAGWPDCRDRRTHHRLHLTSQSGTMWRLHSLTHYRKYLQFKGWIWQILKCSVSRS